MLALARGQQIDLSPSRREGAGVLAADAEQDQFGDVAEVEADAAAVRAAVLADLVPDDVGLVGEAPRLHHGEAIGQHRVGAPQIKVRRRCRYLRNRERADLAELHGAIARQTLVLRSYLPGLVGELPGRVGKDGRKAAAIGEAQQILSGRKHPRLQNIRRDQCYTRYADAIISCSRYVLKIVGDKNFSRCPPRLHRGPLPMSTIHLIPADLLERYHVKEWRNATGVLSTACPKEWDELQEVLRQFKLLKSEVRIGGGNRSLISRRIDEPLYAKGWVEKKFDTSIIVDTAEIKSPTHAVDCFKGGVAVEMEWNNKDPFFDRDLNNFRLLFDLRAIQVGIIITRAWELQEIFKSIGKGSSYGKATTHHEKLWPKIEGGGGGGCPVLTFAIKPENFVDDGEAAYLALKAKVDAEKATKKGGSPVEDEDDED
jgi:hypothetical protein